MNEHFRSSQEDWIAGGYGSGKLRVETNRDH